MAKLVELIKAKEETERNIRGEFSTPELTKLMKDNPELFNPHLAKKQVKIFDYKINKAKEYMGQGYSEQEALERAEEDKERNWSQIYFD